MKTTKLFLALGLGLGLSVGSSSAAFQQEKEKSDRTAGEKKKGKRDRSNTSSANALTGCLAEGDTAGTYVLTDESTGTKTTVTGPAALAKHVGHRVTLTGTSSDGGFKVENIKHLAATCKVGQ